MKKSTQDKLEDSLNVAGDGLGILMRALRMRADLAKKDGENAKYRSANALYNEAVIISLSRLRLKIKKVDNSQEVKDLIRDLKDINNKLKAEAKLIKDLNQGITESRKLIANVEKLVTEVIKIAA